MNVLFVINYCQVCHYCKKAVMFLNNRLPFDQRIDIVDILLSGDPRCAILEEYFQTSNRYEWAVPVLVVEKPTVQKMFNTYLDGMGQRLLVSNITSTQHYFIFIKRYMGC